MRSGFFPSFESVNLLSLLLCFVKFAVQRGVDIRNRPRIPIPDEDPYSVAGNGSGSSGSNTSGPMMPGNNGPPTGYVAATREQLLQQARRSDKPPKLPPRDNMAYPHDIPKVRA